MSEPVSAEVLDHLGTYALRYVRPGQTLGLGSGHAASAFIRALGQRRIKVRGVATSAASAELARSFGIEIVALDGKARLDVDIDGADEVDPRLNLVKGYGGALVREKIVACASRKVVILVGAEKRVSRLGQRGRLPVEVVPFAAHYAMRRMRELGLKPSVRIGAGGREFLSDNGNLVVDCAVGVIDGPARLERGLLAIPGVVGTGLFIGIAGVVLVANGDGSITRLERRR
ncbi:MAG TPA: ribose-5-phosphate isomerase RpiA [Candidatus Binataceae bacterium]|nr:ribose-5-phosphate isomerase RpiA [Candidatus Binataceae bacterium]